MFHVKNCRKNTLTKFPEKNPKKNLLEKKFAKEKTELKKNSCEKDSKEKKIIDKNIACQKLFWIK